MFGQEAFGYLGHPIEWEVDRDVDYTLALIDVAFKAEKIDSEEGE